MRGIIKNIGTFMLGLLVLIIAIPLVLLAGIAYGLLVFVFGIGTVGEIFIDSFNEES